MQIMIFKYCLTVSGDHFIPDDMLPLIKEKYLLVGKSNPNDKENSKSDFRYGLGYASFFHPKKFATEDFIVEYNEWFVSFIKSNKTLFFAMGVNDLSIYIEVYFDGGQCNFEIFKKEQLLEILNVNISFPVSIYLLKKRELREWEIEITKEWKPKLSET